MTPDLIKKVEGLGKPRLVGLRCWLYRAAGRGGLYLAFPLFAFDAVFSWLAKAVTLLCAIVAAPSVTFYDWCVKRHNALRARALEARERGDG